MATSAVVIVGSEGVVSLALGPVAAGVAVAGAASEAAAI
jgi:hypothetical protein